MVTYLATSVLLNLLWAPAGAVYKCSVMC